MSSEVLRRAAALMRERADAAPPGPWLDFVPEQAPSLHFLTTTVTDERGFFGHLATFGDEAGGAPAHAASWHPAVALAVADWLEVVADDLEMTGYPRALTVARRYLGEEAE